MARAAHTPYRFHHINKYRGPDGLKGKGGSLGAAQPLLRLSRLCTPLALKYPRTPRHVFR